MPFLRHATTDAKNVLVGRGSSAPQAKRVMVGAGSSAVEVWPGVYDINMDFTFANQDQLKWAPVTGFDSRTSSASPLAPGFVSNEMFVAGDNSAATYYTRLVDQEADQLPLTFTVTLGWAINTLAQPSYVVLSANRTMTHMLIAEFGSDGFRVFSLFDGSLYPGVPYNYSQTYSPGDQLIIELRPDTVVVGKVGGEQTAFYNINMIGKVRTGAGRMYFGFGVYSTSGQRSSQIQGIKITGKTTQKRVLVASEALARITIPASNWTEVARSVVPKGGVTPVFLIGASWTQASATGDRLFRLKVDGSIMGTTADEGSSLSFSGLTLFDNSVVIIEAFAVNSNSAYRKVSGGVLQIGDPALPT